MKEKKKSDLFKGQSLQFGHLLHQPRFRSPDLRIHRHRGRPVLFLSRQFRFLHSEKNQQIHPQSPSKKKPDSNKKKHPRFRDEYLEGGVNVGLDGGVEAGESIFAGDVRIATVLLDVVLIVLLADRVDSS